VFPVHRCVIAASSRLVADFFNRSSASHVSATPTLAFDGLRAEAVRSVVGYAYTGRADLPQDHESLRDLYRAARHLQMDELERECEDLIVRTISVDNLAAVVALGRSSGGKESRMRRRAVEFAVDRFADAALLDFDFDAFCDVIGREELEVPETEILAAAMRWIAHDLATRERHLTAVTRLVRLELLEQRELSAITVEYPWCGGEEHADFLESIIAAVRARATGKMTQCERRGKGSVYVIVTDVDGEQRFRRHSSDLKRRVDLPAPPQPRRSCAAVSFGDDDVMLIGGADTFDAEFRIELGATRRVDVWSRGEGRWRRGADMLAPRRDHCACAHQTRVLAIGGVGDDDELLSSCEVYDGARWTATGDLRVARSEASAASLAGRVWVLGGVTRDHVIVDTVEFFDGRLWCALSVSMLRPRRGHVAVTSCDAIYVIGGCDDDEGLMERFDGERFRAVKSTTAAATGRNFDACAIGRGVVMMRADPNQVCPAQLFLPERKEEEWEEVEEVT
ncbi:MAG: BTB/POZ domain-containing protein, partial [Planctomycetota bacterium]